MAYRMAPLPATFSDLEGHFRCLKPFHLTYLWKYIVYYLQYLYTGMEKRTWLVISTIFSKNKYFSKSQPVTYRVHCKCFNISETVQDSISVATDH